MSTFMEYENEELMKMGRPYDESEEEGKGF
jgi:hypothetical protein